MPTWFQYVQPLALVFIGLVGAWIAYRQMRIADAKLEHDLYGRRYAVYNAARKVLAEVVTHADFTLENLRIFVVGTNDAVFLFDDALVKYLLGLRNRAAKLNAINVTLEGMPVSEQRAKAVQASMREFEWLVAQLDGLAEKFKPFLKLSRRQRTGGPWWRRQLARWR